ncbi:MAG: helix-turn-helix transcriptional regulator [Chloroflexota bacterium]|nr:helix-turn-helix transcriptional regulator [Chloroflexota bacterium]
MSELTATTAAIPDETRGGPTSGSDSLPLGEILRRMRGERSLRDVERDTGVANSHLCNVERGSQQPGLKFLGRMADYYQTSVAEIIRQAELLRDAQDNPHRLMAADVERSYRFVAEDPRLQPWEEPEEALSIDAKRQVVRTYELLTGRTLLGSAASVP